MSTIRDVARLAGVSTATVSATLSGTAFVSEALRARVREAVEKLNYSPHGVARSLKRGSTRLIGLVIPDVTNPFLTEFVQDHWPFGRHALGIGVNGGGFRYGHEEFRNGSYKDEESFWGHGAEFPISYYAGTKLFDKLPLQGQIRVTPSFVVYSDSFGTADRFRLPEWRAVRRLRCRGRRARRPTLRRRPPARGKWR